MTECNEAITNDVFIQSRVCMTCRSPDHQIQVHSAPHSESSGTEIMLPAPVLLPRGLDSRTPTQSGRTFRAIAPYLHEGLVGAAALRASSICLKSIPLLLSSPRGTMPNSFKALLEGHVARLADKDICVHPDCGDDPLDGTSAKMRTNWQPSIGALFSSMAKANMRRRARLPSRCWRPRSGCSSRNIPRRSPASTIWRFCIRRKAAMAMPSGSIGAPWRPDARPAALALGAECNVNLIARACASHASRIVPTHTARRCVIFAATYFQ